MRAGECAGKKSQHFARLMRLRVGEATGRSSSTWRRRNQNENLFRRLLWPGFTPASAKRIERLNGYRKLMRSTTCLLSNSTWILPGIAFVLTRDLRTCFGALVLRHESSHDCELRWAGYCLRVQSQPRKLIKFGRIKRISSLFGEFANSINSA